MRRIVQKVRFEVFLEVLYIYVAEERTVGTAYIIYAMSTPYTR